VNAAHIVAYHPQTWPRFCSKVWFPRRGIPGGFGGVQGEGTEDDITARDREDVLSKDDQVKDVGQSKMPTVPKWAIKRIAVVNCRYTEVTIVTGRKTRVCR